MKISLGLKPSIGVRVSQRLALTPQIQQALRVLQMGSLDVLQEVKDALESNIMLERVEEEQDHGAVDASDDADAPADAPSDAPGEEADASSELGREDREAVEFTDIPQEQVVDVSWDQIYGDPVISGGNRSEVDWTERTPAAALGLRGQLLSEIPLLGLDDRGQAIAMVLVDALDPRGWLLEDMDSLVRTLAPEIESSVEELESVRGRLCELAPPGVGARDLRECLLLQLDQLPETTSWLQEARLLVKEHLELIRKGETGLLARRLKVTPGQLQQIMRLVRTLDPCPGLAVEASTPELLLPDLVVRRIAGGWLVEMNAEAMPRIRINTQYAELARSVKNPADAKALQEHLVQARGLMQNLERRGATLLRVARSIVRRQHAFLEHGPEAMRPMVLREIAEELELHETTISRATTQKYMSTPRGTFELKYFFSSQVSGEDNRQVSSIAVRAMLKKLIKLEPSRRPHSDARLSQLLGTRGIRVARRTVAKYRGSMAIPGCQERRRTARLSATR